MTTDPLSMVNVFQAPAQEPTAPLAPPAPVAPTPESLAPPADSPGSDQEIADQAPETVEETATEPVPEAPPVDTGTAGLGKMITDWAAKFGQSAKPASKVRGTVGMTPELLDKFLTRTIKVGEEAVSVPWLRKSPEGTGNAPLEEAILALSAKIKKNRIPDEVTREAAAALHMTLPEAQDLFKRGDIAPRVLASHQLLNSAVMALLDLKNHTANRGKVPSPEELAALGQLAGQALWLTGRVSENSSEIGAGLRAVQTLPPGAKTGQALSKAMSMQGMTPEALMAGDPEALKLLPSILAPFEKPHQVSTFMKMWQAAPDAFAEAYIAGLVSGPTTHVANIVGNSFAMMSTLIERQLAGFSGTLHGGQKVYMGEALQAVLGGIEGFKDVLKTGVATGLGAKVDFHAPAISASRMGLDGTVMGQAVDYMGTFIRLPLSALSVSDNIFRAGAHRMELRPLAYRMAKQRGLSGAEKDAFMAKVMSDPKTFKQAHSKAEDFSAYVTFNRHAEGLLADVGRSIQSFNVGPVPAGRMLAPFVNTPIQLFDFAFERTPLIQLLYKDIRNNVLRGGVEGDIARGKVAMAGMLAAAIATYAYDGKLIGRGALDPELRQMQEQAGQVSYSYFDGDTYLPLTRTEPLGMVVAMVTDAAIFYRDGGDDNGEYAAAVLAVLSGVVEDRTFLTSVSQFFNALDNAKQGEYRRGMNSFAGSYVRGLVPYSGMVHELARTLDPQVKEVQSIGDHWYAGLPGYSKGVPPKRDVYERPVLREDLPYGLNFVNPWKLSESKLDEPGMREIVRLKMVIDRGWAKTIAGPQALTVNLDQKHEYPGLPLNRKEQDDLRRTLRNVEIGGKTIGQAVDFLVETAGYQGVTDYMKQELINQQFTVYRAYAVETFLASRPNLRRQRDEALERIPRQKYEPGVTKPHTLPKGY